LTLPGLAALTSASDFSGRLDLSDATLEESVDAPTTALPYAPITGAGATTYRTLGPVAIGLAPHS
jgi:hypothetical protein